MNLSLPNEGIELLYTRDCRAWQQALANLRVALAALEINEDPKLVPIDTLDQAEAYNFFASPTIHIDGVDIDPHTRRTNKRGLGTGRPYFANNQSYLFPPVELLTTALTELYFKKIKLA